jgi:hypothetical protein
MTDIVERLKTGVWHDWHPEIDMRAMKAEAELRRDAIAEIERLRAGGCARDQTTTQYCAEAVALAARVAELESRATERRIGDPDFRDGLPPDPNA